MEGANTGRENAEGMVSVGVRLTAQLGAGFGALTMRCIREFALRANGMVLTAIT